MANADERDDREIEYQKFATREPELTVLTDHTLRPEEAYLSDRFELRYGVGPIYDIIRHEETQTPMSIAIYGDWGAGKTTAMKWLHGLINEWNKNGQADEKIKIKPVWFYPWKYDKKEDVWQGLIAEVIWNAMADKIDSVKSLSEALKQVGVFLGKSAINIISAVKITVPGFENQGKAIEKIIKNMKEAVYPEKPYLNPFEDTLKTWVKKYLGEKQRMIIFIDDLDRCMPEIALQVLEALKLYLNIDGLIFVVGVDPVVINKVVEEHYKRLGFDPENEIDKKKISRYLAKMFQVEINLSCNQRQIEEFLDEKLSSVKYWKEEKYLEEEEKDIIRRVILSKAKRNPREIKRMINSSLIRGTGALMLSGEQE
jgi:predicted KAP-like P-loop ATPase